MIFNRRDVWALGSATWNETLEWYAKGVRITQQRPLADPTSWWFLAAMHGINRPVWDQFGYAKNQPLPSNSLQTKFWSKCQHQSWYFLPWHRGYLAAFEAILREAIIGAGGPQDWALPYWNYNNTVISTSNEMPPAFTARTMPDGSPNALFVTERYGDGQGHFVLDRTLDIPLDALGDGDFTGGDDSIPPGFGGPETIFHHGGEDEAPNGHLESVPHNNVHVVVGGFKPGTTSATQNDPQNQGLMTNPSQAALDPIFWLHHANIDRLWESWRQSTAHAPPGEDTWLSGPVGDPFFMPTPSGGEWQFAAQNMLDLTGPNLSYSYEELTPLPPSRLDQRVSRLNLPQRAGNEILAEGLSVSQDKPAELIGSNETSVDLAGGSLSTVVKLDGPSIEAIGQSHDLRAATKTGTEPDRVFLKLEHVRGDNDGAFYYVYVGLSKDDDPKAHPKNFAGSLSFFGVSKATATDGSGAGNGITQVFEITDVVDALHLSGRLTSVDQLGVRFVPRGGSNYGGALSIGRVSIFRKRQ